MRVEHLVRVCVCCTLFHVALVGSPSAAELAVPLSPHYDLLFTDLVIRGVVEEVENEYMRAATFRPQLPEALADKSIRLTRVAVSVLEVLKGDCDQSRIVILADVSDVPGRLFGPGSEAVVSLYRRHDLGDSIYELKSTGAYYERQDVGWTCDGKPYAIEDIRETLAKLTFGQMAIDADRVVTGTVRDVNAAPWVIAPDGPQQTQTITFEVDGGVKGAGDSQGVLTLSGVVGGAYQVEMPGHLEAGQRYYAFLVSSGSGYKIIGGVNGFLRISGDRLIYRDETELRISKPGLDKMLATFVEGTAK